MKEDWVLLLDWTEVEAAEVDGFRRRLLAEHSGLDPRNVRMDRGRGHGDVVWVRFWRCEPGPSTEVYVPGMPRQVRDFGPDGRLQGMKLNFPFDPTRLRSREGRIKAEDLEVEASDEPPSARSRAIRHEFALRNPSVDEADVTLVLTGFRRRGDRLLKRYEIWVPESSWPGT